MANEHIDHPLAFENHHDEENKSPLSVTSNVPIKTPSIAIQHRTRSATSFESRHEPPRKALPLAPPKQLPSEAVDQDPLSKQTSSPETPGLIPFIHRFFKDDKSTRNINVSDEVSNLTINNSSPPI